MAIKLYYSPSSQPANKYAIGNTNEQEQCRKIAKKCVEASIRCGFDALAGMNGNMYSRVEESNAWGANAHIPIHTNAFDGKTAGFRGFYYNAGSEGHKLVAAIEDTVAPITPGTSDGLSSQRGLYEVYASNAPCAYLEIGFHDNPEEAQYIIDHTEDLAEAIVKGVCNHYGVAYIEDGVVPKEPVNDTYTLEQFVREVQAATGAKVDGIAGPETISKTVTVSRYINDTHPVVKPIQKRLAALGYTQVGEADGEAGPKFAKALQAFQANNHCWVDGEATAGMKTWRKLLGME
jgi:hypothetical protein